MSTKIGGMVIKKGLAGGGKGSTRSDAFTRGGTWAEGGWYEEDVEGGLKREKEEAWGRHNGMGCGTLI